MMAGVSGADVGMVSAAAAVVIFAIAYALMRSDRRDPLEHLAAWAQTNGLAYMAPESEAILATFTGEVDGFHVEVSAARVARGFGNDLPTRVTTVTVGRSATRGTRICALQPAAWVLDMEGRPAGDSVPSGDEAFDAEWSARGADADASRGVLTTALRERLLHADARGLVIEIASSSVAIPMPGLCSDARELDTRMNVALALARELLDH